MAAIETSSFQVPFQLFQAYQKTSKTSYQYTELLGPQNVRSTRATASRLPLLQKFAKQIPKAIHALFPFAHCVYPASQIANQISKNSKAVLKSNIACCAKPMHMLCGYLKDREVLSF